MAASARFGALRPNDGSTFVVAASSEVAASAVQGLRQAGVLSQDIQIVPGSGEIRRTDRSASVPNCERDQQWGMNNMLAKDDGFGWQNYNSVYFGCAVRSNIVKQVADPRDLVGHQPFSGRDGVRANDLLTKFGTGSDPQRSISLPDASMSGGSSGGGSSGSGGGG
jgi:type IV pilus biogenesis protein CpaD/CtpE